MTETFETSPDPEHTDALAIALRAYAEPPQAAERGSRREAPPSDITLIFDTETTTDPGQSLRFGTYQVRRCNVLCEAGLFYRRETLTSEEIELLTDYAEQHGLTLRAQDEFIERIFYGIGYNLRATIVGFNLPFDISRLARRYGAGRGKNRGAFRLTLSEDKRRPAVRIKHLSRRMSFISFAAPFRQRTVRSERRRGRKAPVRPGFFVDVSTLAHALISRSFSLASLAAHLGVSAKAVAPGHGGPLTDSYIAYAVQDVERARGRATRN